MMFFCLSVCVGGAQAPPLCICRRKQLYDRRREHKYGGKTLYDIRRSQDG